MPTRSLNNSGINDKRKLKTKIPKRLRRKNKQNDNNNTDENPIDDIPRTDQKSLTRQNLIEQCTPLLLNTSSSNTTETNPIVLSNDENTSIYYWKYCTKRALDILEKQASNRRKLLIERHKERINSIQYLFYQRQQIEVLTEKNHSICETFDSLRHELRTKEENLKNLEKKLHDHNNLIDHNEFLRIQLKLMEQKFERFTNEYSRKLEENRQHECEYTEQIQSLMDEIERIKRDLVLEEYRKQEAERKVRYYDEKITNEQNLNKKFQQDLIQLKQELKSIHMRYDSLQIEMLAMHKANNNEISLIPTKDTNESSWSKKREINNDIDEQTDKKRKTRHRTQSIESTESSSIERKSKTNQKNDSTKSSLTIKRKTLQKDKKHLPLVTLTQGSPSVTQTVVNEQESSQLLIPSSATDSHDTSCESQPIKTRTNKQSRYPNRRAQRPVKQIENNDQIKQ